MLTKEDLGNLYSLIERTQVSGKDVETVYQLKMKLIGIMKAISAKENELSKIEKVSETPASEVKEVKTEQLDAE